MIPLGLKVAGGNGYETAAVDTSDTNGKITASVSGTNDVAGSWIELIASADFDANMLEFSVETTAASTTCSCIQIGVGASSAVAIMDWYRLSRNIDHASIFVRLPLNIKAGDRVWVRSNGTAWVSNRIHGVGLTNVANLPTLKNEDFGLEYASDYRTLITIDTGGTAHTKSAWVEVESACALDIKQLDVIFELIGDTSGNSAYWYFDIATGASGSEVVLIPNRVLETPAWSNASGEINFRFDVNIPAGTRIAIRAQSDNITVGQRELYVSVNGWGN